MQNQQSYQIFDTAEDQSEVYLRLTSNKNIERVADVLCNYQQADFDQRLYYAKRLGEVPIARDDEGKPERNEQGDLVVEFENKYKSAKVYWSALATALFAGCPKLVRFNDKGEAELNPEFEKLNNCLIRQVVHQGLQDFLGKFGLKPFEQNSLFSLFQIDQNNPNLIDQAADILQENSNLLNVDEESMKTKSKHGETTSPAGTKTGNS